LILRAFSAKPQANSPATLAPELAVELAGELASPNKRPALNLGPPLTLAQAARLIGCSPWTVRQTLIPRGLPYFRFRANGRLVFYRDQIIRWIEKKQGGTQ
jgi:hypothetical protein